MNRHAEFSNAGLPAGDAGAEFWAGLTGSLLERSHSAVAAHHLYLLRDPVTTALTPQPVDANVIVMPLDTSGAGDDVVKVVYRCDYALQSNDAPETFLPGLVAPMGTSAVVLVSTGRGSPNAAYTGSYGPSGSTPGVEGEASEESAAELTAFVVTLDGEQWGYLHRDGDVVPAEEIRLAVSGVVPGLLRRVIDLPVEPPVTFGEVLGRVSLLATVDLVQDRRFDPSVVPLVLLTRMAQLLDGLETEYVPTSTDTNLRHVMVPGVLSGMFADQAQAIRAVQSGLLSQQAARVAAAGWDGLMACPGRTRWLVRDEQGTFMDERLWDWYGPGHVARLIHERLPGWDEVVRDVVEVVPLRTAHSMLDMLGQAGWSPPVAG